MLYGLLVSFFIILCLLLVLMVLVQRGKGSAGIGNLGGGTQLLFGGSGGADVFQKVTWIMGALFMCLSLVLALMKSSSSRTSKYVIKSRSVQTEQVAQASQDTQAGQAGQAEQESTAK